MQREDEQIVNGHVGQEGDQAGADEGLRIKVQLQPNDLLAYNRTFFTNMRFFGVVALGFSVLAVWSISSILAKGIQGTPPFAVGFTIFIILIPFILRRAASKGYNNKFIKEEKTYTIDDDGIIMESPSVRSTFRWSDIVRQLVTKNAVYLFISSSAALLFPLRELSERERTELLAMIHRHVPVRKNRTAFAGRLLFYLMFFLVVVGVIHFIANKD